MEMCVRAFDVTEKDIYHPEVRPGYAAWVSVWRGASRELLLSFCEKRRRKNPSYRSIPLEFMEAMSLPIKYQVSFCNGSPDILTEGVVMRSADEGDSWTEVGRADTGGLMNIFAYASLADGSMLRGIDTSYVSFTRDDEPFMGIEKSSDGGNTWSLSQKLLKADWLSCPYRLKRLRDGTLVLLSSCTSAFGPGRPRMARGTSRPNVENELVVMSWFSSDEGASWTGPVIVLPAINAPEPDFVELPSGDLLLLNSSVQTGPQVRQYVHRRDGRFVPGPVFRVVSGTVPEAVCVTSRGLLVGARRGGAYTCSNDEGKTWHEISGLPTCNYQPQIIELEDGRFLCAWHMHGDCVFGEHHQHIGQHVFRLDASSLPEATTLDLLRDMNSGRTQFINSCTARLAAGGRGLPGRKIRFWTQLRFRDTYDLSPPAPVPQEAIRESDANGEAKLALGELYPDLESDINIHQHYTVHASFTPDDGDSLSPAESPSFHAYIVTPERGVKNGLLLYVAGAKLFFDRCVLDELPELKTVVETLGKSRGIDPEVAGETLGVSGKRFEEIMAYLVRHDVVARSGSSGYLWRYDLSGGLQEIEVLDDFV